MLPTMRTKPYVVIGAGMTWFLFVVWLVVRNVILRETECHIGLLQQHRSKVRVCSVVLNEGTNRGPYLGAESSGEMSAPFPTSNSTKFSRRSETESARAAFLEDWFVSCLAISSTRLWKPVSTAI
jgi:hypothetical protein